MSKFLCCVTFSNLQNYINTSKKPKELKIKSKEISIVVETLLNQLKNKNDIIYPYIKSNNKGLGNTILFTSTSQTIENELSNILRDINILALEVYFASVVLGNSYTKNYKELSKKIFIKKLNRVGFYNIYMQEKKYCYTDHIFKFSLPSKTNDNDSENNYSVSHYALGAFNTNKQSIHDFYKKINDLNLDVESFYEKNATCDNINDKETIKKLKNYINNNPLSKYYSLYRIDIDDLGKRMSKQENIDDQKKLTKIISDFFFDISNEIKKMDCVADVIYTGGDDLIAILPVVASLEFLIKIKQIFKPLCKYKLSFTQGIFITSIKSDFSEILRNSVTIMDEAKNYRLKKDICVLSVLTEGYTNKEAYISNCCVENLIEVIKFFDLDISFFHQKIDLSLGNIAKFDSNFNEIKKLFLKMFKYHLRRSIKSNIKIITKNKSELYIDKSNESIITDIYNFAKEIIYMSNKKTDNLYMNLMNLMNIIQFLLKGGKNRDGFNNN